MKILITGSCGLVGSEAVAYYAAAGHEVLGIDNNMRKYFFGAGGDTSAVRERLESDFARYRHEVTDIRDRKAVFACVREFLPDFILHAAGQPSHDWAAKEPFTDFDINAGGTLNLLEATRQFRPDAVFVFLSTNKVYGDSVNRLAMEETSTRFEYRGERKGKGIAEDQSIDANLHSLFGASKTAADLFVQEYGRYFGMKTVAFRAGCLTGSRHAAVEQHGFLAYLVRCAVDGTPYTIYGYKGKQVRDQLHASDVIQAIELFRKAPRKGEAYNLGGGSANSASILELVDKLRARYGLDLAHKYVDSPRKGDHVCYYTDMTKFRSHYAEFGIRMSLDSILDEMVESFRRRAAKAA